MIYANMTRWDIYLGFMYPLKFYYDNRKLHLQPDLQARRSGNVEALLIRYRSATIESHTLYLSSHTNMKVHLKNWETF